MRYEWSGHPWQEPAWPKLPAQQKVLQSLVVMRSVGQAAPVPTAAVMTVRVPVVEPVPQAREHAVQV